MKESKTQRLIREVGKVHKEHPKYQIFCNDERWAQVLRSSGIPCQVVPLTPVVPSITVEVDGFDKFISEGKT